MIGILILAAGKSTRMKSDKPKPLVEVRGRPLLSYVIDTVKAFGKPFVVVGHKAEDVIAQLGHTFTPVYQKEQKGTGHAVLVAQDALQKSGCTELLVLFADQPLISKQSIEKLINTRREAGAAFSLATVAPTDHMGNNAGFEKMGRIVRASNGAIEAIVEYKDADQVVRALTEVNISLYCFDAEWLWKHLPLIENKNASGEYYLTDLVAIARANDHAAVPVVIPTQEGVGANTLEEITILEKYL